ncbi:membrane protein [Mycobacterium phage PenguinLover67]|nr:membrane protein [Mycobacterium phage PenguinLover67]
MSTRAMVIAATLAALIALGLVLANVGMNAATLRVIQETCGR